MPTLRFGQSTPETRSWDIAEEVPVGHLLRELLLGNLGEGLESCELLFATACEAAADDHFEEDLGFLNSVAVSFANGVARLEHVISDNGSYEIPAEKLAYVISEWIAVVSGKNSSEVRIEVP